MAYQFDWSVLLTYRHLLWNGLVLTVELSAAAMAASLVLGSLVGLGRSSEVVWLRRALTAYVEFFRNIPLIVQLFFWYFAVGLETWPAALLGLTAYTSAYIGEVVRAGIQSIPGTQFEAARSFGMTAYQVVRHVIFPQALMRIVPALAIEFINVIKNSSIAMTISLTELTFQTQQIESQTFRGFEAATAITLLYVVLAFTIVLGMNRLERALRLDLRIG
ncbi:MAG: amino acid ABC transporter permease [Candidatus Rokubacteria bacterium]|nr:amino acid ABC transporter permease [Candidatus Rokubacteria bacterium]MBI3105879.1 amino acid ABC transporter permease [Candidatus Rokubacteria bacterium]